MQSLLDSYLQISENNAVFSILKMGKRFVGLIEECVESKRQITLFSFIKTPLKFSLLKGGIIDDINKKCIGFLIFDQKIVDIKTNKAILDLLSQIENFGYFSVLNWSSSYLISSEQTLSLFAKLEWYKSNSFQYDSINARNGTSILNNQGLFTTLLEKAGLEISLPPDEDDPVMFDNIVHSFRFTSDSSLLIASYKNDLNQVKSTISNGANLNLLVNVGLLRTCAATFFYSRAIDGLYKYDKFSPLMFAVCHKNEVMVRCLIDNKADIDIAVKIKDNSYTAMDFAILFNLTHIVTAFYDLDAKHYLPLFDYKRDNLSLIKSIGLAEFMPDQLQEWPENAREQLMSVADNESNLDIVNSTIPSLASFGENHINKNQHFAENNLQNN